MSIEEEICTSAMVKLGAEPISDLSDDTKEARLCRIQYPKIRDAILRSAPWSFAMKRVELAPIAEDLLFGDGNKFQLPQDCVKFVKLYAGEGYVSNDRYTIEGDHLISTLETIQGWYVTNEVEVEKYDPNFKEAVACALASDLCYAITQSNTLKQGLMAESKFWIDEARSYNSQEVTPEDFVFDEFLNARRGGHALY
jgi:hypothetical protein